MLIETLKDSSVIVRDTGAWTIGRICEILPDAVIQEQYLNPLLGALVEGLGTEPRVASNVCWVSMLRSCHFGFNPLCMEGGFFLLFGCNIHRLLNGKFY